MGNIGALISPLLAGIVVDQLGWSMTLQLLIVPAVIALFYGSSLNQINHLL